MNTRRLLFALIVAIAISGLFTLWISRKIARARGNSTHLQYVATARAVDAGETLREEDVIKINWPSSAPLAGTFVRQQDVVGRTVLYPLAAGEPLQEQQMAAAGSGAGLSTKIPAGMRALSLKSDPVVGVAGFLFPGTHVDVLVTYVAPSSATPVTATVLQDAEILAAGEKMEPDPKGKASPVDVVTILVSPQDAEKVVLASTQGRVHFVLRNGTDTAQVTEAPMQLAGLGPLADSRPPARAKPPKARPAALPAPVKYSVQVVNGDKATTESFQ